MSNKYAEANRRYSLGIAQSDTPRTDKLRAMLRPNFAKALALCADLEVELKEAKAAQRFKLRWNL